MTTELQNKAWSCLPKEFKEEVKKEWELTDNIERLPHDAFLRGKCQMMRDLFGHHNLNSDAERDEMLTVSRKQVQEMYADIINDIRDYNGENPEMVGTTDPILRERAAGMKAQLHILFGSKCLPDEACNIASSDVASSEPKPTEPKFKVGDKVRILSLHGSPTPDNGVVDVIAHINKGNRKQMYYLENHYHCAFGFSESDLEPYTEPTANKIGNPDISTETLNASKSVPLESEPTSNYLHVDGDLDKSASTCTDDCSSQCKSQSRNLSQFIANCDKCSCNRLTIAAMAMQGLLSNPSWTVTKVCRAKEAAGDDSDKAAAILIKEIAEDAVEFADALIRQCEKGEES